MQTPYPAQLTLEYNPPQNDMQFLDCNIYDYNRAQTGKNGHQTFTIYQRHANGEMMAGLSGCIWAQVCEIQRVWVHPTIRKQGIGRSLMEMAEQEAQKHNCHVITLNVYSFQSPAFFTRLGYQVAACVDDCPPGYQTFHLVKRLLKKAVEYPQRFLG
jgi:GNAT superfamily N-acetyltransferase